MHGQGHQLQISMGTGILERVQCGTCCRVGWGGPSGGQVHFAATGSAAILEHNRRVDTALVRRDRYRIEQWSLHLAPEVAFLGINDDGQT